MKSNRRKGRADALQILYQLDLNQDLTPVDAVGKFEDHFGKGVVPRPVDPFTRMLVEGVRRHLVDIDAVLNQVAENWRLERMAVVDRNILRLGAFELQYCDDIPSTVTINEMVELGKSFGAETSPKFINGILDKVKSVAPASPSKAP